MIICKTTIIKREFCLDIEHVFVEPDYNRPEFYTGDIEAHYEFNCPRCLEVQQLDFMTLFNNAHHWRSNFSDKQVSIIENCFNISLIPIAEMTPSITHINCDGCSEDFLLYIGITHLGLDECYHSVFKLSEQGITLISL
jgi:hypothetical protein